MLTKDKDEWGNIELPGLSDEELLTKNWNVVAAAQERSKNTTWRENQAKVNAQKKGKSYVLDLKKNDPAAYAEWLEHHRQVTKEAGQQ